MPRRKSHVALVVEPDSCCADALAELVEGMGHAHEVVGSKEEALQILEPRPCCYVLMNLRIRRKPRSFIDEDQGYELLRAIRARHGGDGAREADRRRLPIIVVSSHAGFEEDVKRALEAGADIVVDCVPSARATPLEDTIRQALHASHRARHAQCGARPAP